jgi:multidrug efflux pump subunit AcrA (membrane-fusion protein)
VLVPKDALVRQGPAQIVYIINGDDTISPVQVSPGPALGAWVSVGGAVQAGQKVVTRGNERMQPGQKVSALPVDYEAP